MMASLRMEHALTANWLSISDIKKGKWDPNMEYQMNYSRNILCNMKCQKKIPVALLGEVFRVLIAGTEATLT